jgi:hypothetical protein
MHSDRRHHHHHQVQPVAAAPDAQTQRNRIGHNGRSAPPPAQWQLLPSGGTDRGHSVTGRDFEGVETAFLDGFLAAPDPTSFLRLAGIPFEGATSDGGRLVLLRVESETAVEVGSVMPCLGGTSFQYSPFPGQRTTRSRRLRFVYFDGRRPVVMSFAEARELVPT